MRWLVTQNKVITEHQLSALISDEHRSFYLQESLEDDSQLEIQEVDSDPAQESEQIEEQSPKELQSDFVKDDLAEKEAFELTLLEKYLPEQLSEEQIRQTVKNIVKNTGTGSMQDMGKVMGATMQELAGSADGKIVQKIVQEELRS